MRTGRRLCFDVGQVRTGVAVSSQDGIFASPLGNINSVEDALQVIAEYEPIEVYVGLPLSLSGSHTKSTEHALTFAKALERSSGLPVLMVDERLSTTTAANLLRTAGRNAKKAKSSIDAAAATVILELALSTERAGGLPGKKIEDLL